jgi:6-phosphogluconolactonase
VYEQPATDAEDAARQGADHIAEAARRTIAAKGSFTIAVSGGHGPWRMFQLLAEREVEWPKIDVFQVDERIAPEGDDDRNLTHLMESLPEGGRERVRPMPVNDPDPAAAAERYAAALPDSIDVVHLGLGPDGHTASLVPGDPVLEVRDAAVAITGEYQDRRRMTLTYPTLEAAGWIIWLVTGADKVDALAKLRAGDPSIPAGRLPGERASLIYDAEAAGQ